MNIKEIADLLHHQRVHILHASLEDVAEAAGVSRTTAGSVDKGKPLVSTEAYLRVLYSLGFTFRVAGVPFHSPETFLYFFEYMIEELGCRVNDLLGKRGTNLMWSMRHGCETTIGTTVFVLSEAGVTWDVVHESNLGVS